MIFFTDPSVCLFIMPGGVILYCLKFLTSDKGLESLSVGILASSMIFYNIS